MVNELYGCFGYGMMNGGYGYGWMLFSWLIGLLVIVGLVVFIIWMTKKIQEDNKVGFLERTYNGRKKYNGRGK